MATLKEMIAADIAKRTSNYVLFDDQLPRILETNGVPSGLEPWAKNKATK